ncbi:MAG TPA: glycosyltransferase [Chthoniobacterales bacterium]
MKTVLLICNKIPHYRVSVYNYLRRRFLETGWDLKVASNGVADDNRLDIKFDFRRIDFRFSEYRRLIGDIKPDVVILHLHLKLGSFWSLIHWLKMHRIPIVSWTKGANLDKLESQTRYYLFNYSHFLSDALILYSSNQTACIAARSRHKIFTANNTVNFEDYPDVPESKVQIRAEFGIPFEKVVLFAGTMGVNGERKKVNHLIRIFAQIDRRDVGLVLVGEGLTMEQQKMINPKNTRYLGPVHDAGNLKISKLFKQADIFSVPGHLGLALNQALYWGLPVVTESGDQPPEIQYLKSGRNGFIVAEDNLDELKEKLLYLLDNDAVRSRFSRNARGDILRDASIEGMFSGFCNAVEFAYANQSKPETARPAVELTAD